MPSADSLHRDTVRLCKVFREVIGNIAIQERDGELSKYAQAVNGGIELFPEPNGTVALSVSHEVVDFVDQAARELARYAATKPLSHRHTLLVELGVGVSTLLDSNDRVISTSLSNYREMLVRAGYNGRTFDDLNLFH